MLTVIETDEFSTWAAKVWSDTEREAFVDWIAVNPEAGDVVPGSGGAEKFDGRALEWESAVVSV